MNRAFPYTASFLKHFEFVNPISLQNGEGECVIDILCDHLRVKGKPMNRKKSNDVFDKASNDIYNQCYLKNAELRQT